MKVAVFTDTYLPQINGVTAYLSNSLKLLSKKHDVVLFAPGGKKLRTERASKRFRIYWIPAKAFPFYEGYRMSSVDYKRISELLKKEKPDIVHAHAPVLLGLQGLIAAKRRDIPAVVTYHTHFPDYVPHLLNGKLPKPFAEISGHTVKQLINHVFKMADAVTAPTRELVNELSSYGLSNAVYLPNGVELKRFRKDRKKAAAFRKRFGISGDKKVILYLGRISFEKRIDVLLEAFKMIEKPDRVLVIAGKGPYLDELKELAEGLELSNVIFTGYLKDISPAYATADIFASASDTETFGLTFVEAMHTGLPAVGVRRLGAKEIIRNGKNGILVKPGDTGAFARAMEKLLKNSAMRKRMGKEALRDSEKYSLEESVDKTIKLYRKLVKRGG